MTYNFVTVQINAADVFGNTSLPVGDISLMVNDVVWDTSTGALVVVAPILLTANGGNWQNGAAVPLLAMDNPTLSTNWAWLFTAGIPDVSVPKHKLTVNYASGPAQILTALLATSTIVA